MRHKQIWFVACVWAAAIAAVAFMGRFGQGAIAGVLLLAAMIAALKNQRGFALACFALFPIILTLNPVAFPLRGLGQVINRLSTFAVAICLIFASTRASGRTQLPLAMLIPFLVFAVVSSMQGYFPEISYFKLINFTVFLLGIWIGSRNLDRSPLDLLTLRKFFFAISIFFIIGSLLTLPFPSICYLQNTKWLTAQFGTEAADAMFRERGASETVSFFCGVTNQSQCLGPLLALVLWWMIGDMMLVERRLKKFHAAVIFIGLGLMYLTRSRTALFAFAIGGMVFVGHALGHISLPQAVKRRVKQLAFSGVVALGLLLVIMQIRGGLMTKWVRKTNEGGEDKRSLVEAVTHSRQRLIDEDLADFKYNNLLGCGFQVAYFHPYLYANHKGLILSAPIEKGLLPLMVLGETGVVGAVFFLIFLVSFYAGCGRQKLYMTMTMFSVLLASNIGEADFFSPGGIGGAKWVLAAIGGFVIDAHVIHFNRMNAQYSRRVMG